nr:MerR family transcriptional regulator [Pseudonocardia sp.]
MRIGEVSARTGLSIRTIRHYDHLGIVVPSGRSAGGFRQYSEDDVRRLELVRTLRPLDLSLDQVRELLAAIDLVASGGPGSAEVDAALGRLTITRALAESRMELMRAQITGLERLVRDLRTLERGADRSTSRRS